MGTTYNALRALKEEAGRSVENTHRPQGEHANFTLGNQTCNTLGQFSYLSIVIEGLWSLCGTIHVTGVCLSLTPPPAPPNSGSMSSMKFLIFYSKVHVCVT